jgi:hypothetical protein
MFNLIKKRHSQYKNKKEINIIVLVFLNRSLKRMIKNGSIRRKNEIGAVTSRISSVTNVLNATQALKTSFPSM